MKSYEAFLKKQESAGKSGSGVLWKLENIEAGFVMGDRHQHSVINVF